MIFFLLFVLFILPNYSAASKGDQQQQYKSCLTACMNKSLQYGACVHWPTRVFGLPWWTWPCEDECQYHCMRDREAERAENNEPVLQYHGKWPFIRIWGCQEPLSALFSLSNMAPNVYYAFHTHLFAPNNDDPTMRKMLIGSCYVAMNTWWWSFVYHSKESIWTERADYNFATLHMATYLQLSVLRLIHEFNMNHIWAWVSALILLGFVMYHIWFLNFVDFDYGYNTRVMAYVIGTQVLMWFAWFIVIYRRYRQDARHAMMVIKFQCALLAIVSLELLDFPPLWNHLDAHAIWHCMTCPLTIFWYQFLIADAKWRIRLKQA